jgi:sulfonate transport system permease protein
VVVAGMSAASLGLRVDRRSLVLPVVLVALWTAASASGIANPHVLVPPGTLLAAFASAVRSGDFWTAVGSSLARFGSGWAIGSLFGIAVGVAVGTYRPAERVIAPSLDSVRQVALFAWIPLLTAWFGDGEAAKVILIAVAAFFPVALNTESGCRTTPRALIEVGSVLEFDPWTMLRRVVLPSARPAISAGLTIALTSAWIGTIGAEYLIDEGNGLGVYLASARLDSRMDLVIVSMVTLGAIGLALNAGLRAALGGRASENDVVVTDD